MFDDCSRSRATERDYARLRKSELDSGVRRARLPADVTSGRTPPSSARRRVGVLAWRARQSGLHHVRTVGSDGRRSTDAVGLFAAALRARMPLLPVIEELGLYDPQARDRFIACVFGYARLQAFFGARWSRTGLVAFHADEKLTLARWSQVGERRLAGLLTEAPSLSRAELRAAYSSKFMQVLSRITRSARR